MQNTKTKDVTYMTTWDDGSSQDWRLADLLERYELPGVFFIPCEWIQLASQKGWEPLSDARLTDIAKRFEIGSHGITHTYLTRMDREQAVYEITASKEMLQDKFQKPVRAFAYPRGYADDYLKKVVRKTYFWARNTGIGNINGNEDLAWVTPTVHVYHRKEYGDVDFLSYARLQLKRVREQGGVFHLWGHGWEIERFGLWDDLEKLFIEMQV